MCLLMRLHSSLLLFLLLHGAPLSPVVVVPPPSRRFHLNFGAKNNDKSKTKMVSNRETYLSFSAFPRSLKSPDKCVQMCRICWRYKPDFFDLKIFFFLEKILSIKQTKQKRRRRCRSTSVSFRMTARRTGTRASLSKTTPSQPSAFCCR